ncbi:MAG: addiction module protein [Mucilaginibacter sp.]
MRKAQIRQQLHDYIDSAEDKKLKAIYTLLENDIVDEHQLSTEQKEELNRRYSDHQNGIGRTYAWDEVVAITEHALASRRK